MTQTRRVYVELRIFHLAWLALTPSTDTPTAMNARLFRTLSILLLIVSWDGALSAAEWRDLLVGDSLDGWEFDIKDGSNPASIYTMADRVMTVAGKDKSLAVIRTAQKFSEYDLQFEWRWLDTPGNSGCLIHCSEPRFMSIWPKSIEVQVGHPNAGDFIYIGETINVPDAQLPADQSGWRVRLRDNLTDDSENPAGQWNRMHLRVRTDTVTVWVNGDLVNHGTNPSVTSGAICFQAEGANLQYRKMRIMER